MHLFFALAAAEGMIVTFGDTTNAYQQAPPPTEQCYLTIDDAYLSWYKKRHGQALDPRTHINFVFKSLQGHPEAGALWEKMITKILGTLGFKSTTHECNLYHGKLDGHAVLICRMVNDYAIACRDPTVADKIIAHINKAATIDSLGMGSRFNGVDIVQSRDYIKIHCETYIDCMLQTHGWSHPSPNESDRHDNVPLSPGSIKSLQRLDPGPMEGTTAHHVLQDKMKFSYHQVLGELIYAYVVARLNIGYAVTLLACFSQSPAEEHYNALHGVCKYLRQTKSWGIVYWHDTPVPALPAIPLSTPPAVDSSLPAFPTAPLLQLTGFVDAAHATDLATRRSITGLVFTLAGGAIAYKSKLQPTVSTTSTKAEFIAAVHAAKIAKHLCYILAELGYPQSTATHIYEDNQAAIAMINEDRPTTRSHHIDIQHFAIQEWRSRGIICMLYIPTTINPADASTKALSWVLHSRHVRHSMGHYGIS
jgi:Reverse transcriptase (RNA-dependent DNA polymerase)